MNNYPRLLKFFLCLIIVLTVSCNDDTENDKPLIPLFSESDLSIIHDDSDKQWRITEVINKYYDPNYSLEVELSCLEDDIYTFYATQEEVEINLGETRCFGRNNDGIFTADIEIFEAKLTVMNLADSDDRTIFLNFARGYINNDSTATGVSIRWYKLAELSEDRMVFHRSGGKYLGEYNEALIFEKN